MEKRIPIPDAINCVQKGGYTMIPNTLIRDPLISGKAKAVLCLLLSNRKGWHSYLKTMQAMMKEKGEALSSAMQELEEFGYLRRIRYRDKNTKRWVGSFLAYTDTPNSFDISRQIQFLEKQNMEMWDQQLNQNNDYHPQPGFPDPGNPDPGNPDPGNQVLKRLINKKTKIKKLIAEESHLGNDLILPVQKRNIEYLPIAKHLAKTVRTYKKISIQSHIIKNWANDIRLLAENSKIPCTRIETALDWYKIHIGEPYVPVIQSGASLREKFLKLEDAIERDKHQTNKSTNAYTNSTVRYKDKKHVYREPDSYI